MRRGARFSFSHASIRMSLNIHEVGGTNFASQPVIDSCCRLRVEVNMARVLMCEFCPATADQHETALNTLKVAFMYFKRLFLVHTMQT